MAKTKIKFNLTLGDSCNLTITDTTQYYQIQNNPTGFYAETEPSQPIDTYKLSQGYFKNVIVYNKYAQKPFIVNTNEIFKRIISVDPIYDNNFVPDIYNLSQDGVFTIKRVFIISEEYYNAQKTTGRFDGRIIYYTDGTIIYIVDNGVATPTTMLDFISNDDAFIGIIGTVKIVSTCFINTCYFNIINKLITDGLEVCSSNKSNDLIKQRDFLYMVLEAIKYLKEQGNTLQIQKIIEMTNTCGGICKSVSVSSDCGCNG